MKVNSVVVSLAAAGTLAAATPHRHQHRHHQVKRSPDATEVVTVPGPTVYVYEYNKEPMDKEEACKGIKKGYYVYSGGHVPSDPCEGEEPQPDPSPAEFYVEPTSVVSITIPTPKVEVPEEKPAPPPPAPSPPAPPAPPAPPKISIPSKAKSGGSKYPTDPSNDGEGVDREFPDGELDCGSLPSGYGALNLDWLHLGGYSGIQYLSYNGDAVSRIDTGIRGDKCRDGAMCSYACPPGYQKSQWPERQGSTLESIGGLACRGGKLYLTNPTLSRKLCIPGTGNVDVQNKLGDVVAVCRTDYPGTESETVPLELAPSASKPLTCPNGNTYYMWDGQITSAQYYVNPKGVGIQEGCQWGDGSKPIGNWAPVNLGVGERDGDTWLSIFQNKPTTNEKLDFKVEIIGDVSAECKYENGKYYLNGAANDDGCTVKVISGKATYVFS
ncbi:hypothetical protein AJ80_05581 [Polytolypa hystricis UAMH7299]|uniref:Murein transglycosylase n=1 Tax=Polytolypa hystricis (strain UAMH7299) TaxID=1447883 RepID=A0A2B7Y3Z7_POLH7|nr:hypothetical protein AJ80_05581 [Polytolypa hystricis UAMH7299]